jgi:protein-S-isoprenylcysteine O-methyltransferase Ste14
MMKNNFQSLHSDVVICVVVMWLAFIPIFIFLKKPKDAREQKRDQKSIVGIAIESVAFMMIWGVRRRPFGAIVPSPPILTDFVEAATVLIAAGSVWIVNSAVRTLGKQWTYVARTVEGHELITTGPYSLVRNPIYLGMFGMLVATGLALTWWPVFLAAIVIFIYGTIIRIRSEEKLLRETFGEKFDEYTRRVPALLPGIY